MGMKSSITHSWCVVSALLAWCLSMMLAGCGSAPGALSGSSGSGADGGPWPQSPNRSAAPRPAADETPTAVVMLTLRGKAEDDREVRLDITRVELKSGDTWLTLATKPEIEKIEKLPIRLGPKGSTVLLASARIPRRQYTHLRLVLADDKTVVANEAETWPLTLGSPVLELGSWKLDEKATNGLVVNIDGTKITYAKGSATLPGSGIGLQAGVPAGGIAGKVIPPLPTAKVEAYWGATNLQVGEAVPTANNGAFTLPHLPAGAYRLEVRAAGYRLIAPLKDPVKVEGVLTTVPDLELTSDRTAQ